MVGTRPFSAFSGSYYTGIAPSDGTVDHILNQLVTKEGFGFKFVLVGAPYR